MSGLPKNWTSPRPGTVDIESVKAEFHGDPKAGVNLFLMHNNFFDDITSGS